MRTSLFVLVGFSAFSVLGSAQQRQSDVVPATTTVSGHVFCADTNAPARLATVVLQPAAAVDDYDPDKPGGGVSSRAEAVQTLLDGSFGFAHVAPGTYYVLASTPGYISPLAWISKRSGEQMPPGEPISKQIAKAVPRMTVQANLPATVNVTLERGAAVSGTVLYDDGSPAAGLDVQVLARGKKGWMPLQSSGFDRVSHSSITNDQGVYRISGLLPDEYVLEVQLNLRTWTYSLFSGGAEGISTSSGGTTISIYGGNATQMKDAKPFALKQGEERPGEDLQIPVSKLHTVRGSIIAKHDGHLINGGVLKLLYPEDKSEAGHTAVGKDDDGIFQFNFVPEGDYILRVTGAADYEYEEIRNPPNTSPPTQTRRHLLRGYGPAEISIHVEGDMSGVMVTVPDEQQPPAAANQ